MSLDRASAVLALLVIMGCGGSGDSAAPPATGFFPCDVQAAIKAKCQACHKMPPTGGAPVPIVSYADTQRPSVEEDGKKVWEMMKKYIEEGFMPFEGSPTGPLTAAEKATLLGWLNAGAMPAAQAGAAP